MTALLTRIKRLARSPQGRGAASSVRRTTSAPGRRVQAHRLLGKLRRQR
ncbi:hypothetical protein ACFTUC_05955 [Streptomyces sp. NPDC056944]